MVKQFILIVALFVTSLSASAAIDVYDFENEVDRERYHKFIEELRCPKCKNNNLAGTNSQIAVDLRRELYRMVSEGKSDEHIIDFMVTRYGDFVLYRPRLQSNTVALWVAPFVFGVVGLMVIALIVWQRKKLVKQPAQNLNEEEQKRLSDLLAKANQSNKSK